MLELGFFLHAPAVGRIIYEPKQRKDIHYYTPLASLAVVVFSICTPIFFFLVEGSN